MSLLFVQKRRSLRAGATPFTELRVDFSVLHHRREMLLKTLDWFAGVMSSSCGHGASRRIVHVPACRRTLGVYHRADCATRRWTHDV